MLTATGRTIKSCKLCAISKAKWPSILEIRVVSNCCRDPHKQKDPTSTFCCDYFPSTEV